MFPGNSKDISIMRIHWKYQPKVTQSLGHLLLTLMLAICSCTVHLTSPSQEGKLQMQMCPAAGPQRHLLSRNAVLSSGEGVACAHCRKGWTLLLAEEFSLMHGLKNEWEEGLRLLEKGKPWLDFTGKYQTGHRQLVSQPKYQRSPGQAQTASGILPKQQPVVLSKWAFLQTMQLQ